MCYIKKSPDCSGLYRIRGVGSYFLLEPDFDPLLEEPLEDPFEEPLEDLELPLEEPLELPLDEPFEELLAAFFAVAMLFTI
ncbi:MAG: hypothetical protein ABR503_09265 [Chitinophagaceae bacterium]